VANVIAGQAKSLLAGTEYHFVFATPTVVEGRPAGMGPSDWLAEFASDVGNFTFHMCLNG
jgi:CheY-specific phosphatase CheX